MAFHVAPKPRSFQVFLLSRQGPGQRPAPTETISSRLQGLGVRGFLQRDQCLPIHVWQASSLLWQLSEGLLAQSFLHDVVNQVRHTNRVAPLIVIPGHDLRQVAADGQRVEGAKDG